MLTPNPLKILGALSVAFLLLYIFSDRGIVREGAKGCSKQAQNVAITQQSRNSV